MKIFNNQSVPEPKKNANYRRTNINQYCQNRVHYIHDIIYEQWKPNVSCAPVVQRVYGLK